MGDGKKKTIIAHICTNQLSSFFKKTGFVCESSLVLVSWLTGIVKPKSGP